MKANRTIESVHQFLWLDMKEIVDQQFDIIDLAFLDHLLDHAQRAIQREVKSDPHLNVPRDIAVVTERHDDVAPAPPAQGRHHDQNQQVEQVLQEPQRAAARPTTGSVVLLMILIAIVLSINDVDFTTYILACTHIACFHRNIICNVSEPDDNIKSHVNSV